MPAFRWLIGSIFLRIGRRIRASGARPRYRRRSPSKPSRRSPSSRSGRRAAGLPEGVVLMDAGYGNDTELRTAITASGMSYVAGIGSNTSVWPPGAAPLLPQSRSGRGRPQTRLQRDGERQPISVKALALSLPKEVWQTVAWREGSAERLSSHFARQRVRPAHRDTKLS